MASNQIAAPSVVESVDRRAWALTLRAQGLKYEQIGRQMRITAQTAHTLVRRGLEDRRAQLAEAADHVRDIELTRLDSMWKFLAKRLEDPKNANPERTADSMLRVMERRAKYLGLDAPSDFRLIPGGGPAVPSTEIDLTKLSPEELDRLEAIQAELDAMKERTKPVTLPAGEPVVVVDAPPSPSPLPEG